MIHGLHSSAKTWDEMKDELESAGYTVVLVNYDSKLPYYDYPAIYKSLEREMAIRGHDYNSDGIHFVGHTGNFGNWDYSQGGMALADNRRIPADKITTINSPFAERGYNIRNDSDWLTYGKFGQLDPRIEGRFSGGHGDKPHGDDIIKTFEAERDQDVVSKYLRGTRMDRIVEPIVLGDFIADLWDAKRMIVESLDKIVSGKKKHKELKK